MKSKKKAMRISVIIALILLLTGLYLGYVNRYDRMSGDSEPLIQMESGEQTRVSYEEPDWQMNDFFLVDVLNSAFEDYYSGASYAFVNGINYFRVICEENQCEELEKFPNQNYAAVMDKKMMSRGDLDGDKKDDVVVIIRTRYGKDANFTRLAVFRNNNDKPEFVVLKNLGDRVLIQGMEIVDGLLRVEMLVHGPDDSPCCPKTPKHAVYELIEGTLVELK